MNDLTTLCGQSNFHNFHICEINFNMLPSKGYYFWFTDKEVLRKLNIPISRRLFYTKYKNIKYYLCYIGIGPASNTSSETLVTRIQKKHLNGSTRNSTFRRSISALLRINDKKVISDFIKSNFRICIAEHTSPWEIESELIQAYKPPLNLDFNTSGWFYSEIKKVRKTFKLLNG